MIKNEEDEIIIKLLNDEIYERVNLETSNNQFSKIINCLEEKSKNEINIKINKNNEISVCFLKIIISPDSQNNLDNSPSLYYLISNNNCIDNYSYFFPVLP